MQQLQLEVSSNRLALVVGCTNGKTQPVTPGLRVADLAPGRGRLRQWQDRLAAAPDRHSVRGLYAGAQWAASLRLEQHAKDVGFAVDLWIVSAGLGLVPAAADAPAYAASFARGADSVAATWAGRRAWWQGLSTKGCTFSTLQYQYDQILVVLAPTYLDVVMPELSDVQRGKAAVVSSRQHPLVYNSSGLRQELGASAMTLNARAAEALIDLAGRDPLASADVRARWTRWSSEKVRRASVVRRVAADDEVLAFIRSSLERSPGSRTALLTAFRGRGRACEQSRFQRLYEHAVRSTS